MVNWQRDGRKTASIPIFRGRDNADKTAIRDRIISGREGNSMMRAENTRGKDGKNVLHDIEKI